MYELYNHGARIYKNGFFISEACIEFVQGYIYKGNYYKIIPDMIAFYGGRKPYVLICKTRIRKHKSAEQLLYDKINYHGNIFIQNGKPLLENPKPT